MAGPLARDGAGDLGREAVVDRVVGVAAAEDRPQVELLEPAPSPADSRVIVTFLPAGAAVDLASKQVDPNHAAELRARLNSFHEDWDRPDMDVYDAL